MVEIFLNVKQKMDWFVSVQEKNSSMELAVI